MTALEPLEATRAAPFVGPGSSVIDIGASTGVFALWAAERGADVLAVEPHPENVAALNCLDHGQGSIGVLGVAAGPAGFGRLVEPADEKARATGSIVVPDLAGALAVWPLDLLVRWAQGEVAVLKCDIQGGEYALFAETDDETLRRCRFISIERHQWTTPGEAPVEGWGVVDGPPMPAGAYDEIAVRMARTHSVVEDADLLYCYRDGVPS